MPATLQPVFRDAYDRWAPVYPPVAHNALMLAEQEAVTPWLDGHASARVLDVGAGTGRYTPILRAAGATLVVSLDWSLPMLGGQVVSAARVCGHAAHLPFANAVFDLVNASLMAGDVRCLGPWVRELARVLTAGGRIVYSDFHPTWHTRGWRRTFRDESGATVVLPCEPHTLDDHRRATERAGLRVEGLHEVAVPSPPRSLDRWLGRRGPLVPGLVVVSATKPYGGRE